MNELTKTIDEDSLYEKNIIQAIPEIAIKLKFNQEKRTIEELDFINPYKFYHLYESIWNRSFEEFLKILSEVEKKPEMLKEFIHEYEFFFNQIENLIKNPSQPLSFNLKLISYPKSITAESKFDQDSYFVVFCYATLLKNEESLTSELSKSQNILLFIQDITLENYLIKLITLSSPLGLFTYRETFKYVNDEVCKITGYSREELQQMPIWALVEPDKQETIKQIALKRMQGEKVDRQYNFFPILRKDKKKIWLHVFGNTVYYKGVPHGLGIIIDITELKLKEEKIKKINILYNTLLQVQNLLLNAQSEEEILSNIAKIFIQEGNFLLVWIGKENENHDIIPIYVEAKEENYKNYLKDIKISSKEESPYGRGPTGTAHRENKIIYNNHSFTNPNLAPWIEKLKQYNFFSTASIPIFVLKDIFSINLYIDVENYFDDDIQKLLQLIKSNIEFILLKHYQNRWLKIFQYIIEKAPISLFITNEKNQIIFTNEFTEELTGYSFEEMYLQDPKMFSSNLHSKDFIKSLWDTVLQKKIFSGVFINRNKNGQLYYLKQTIIPIVQGNSITNFTALGIDITDKILLESQLEIQILYDPITKLPNRTFFLKELQTLLNFQLITNKKSSNNTVKFALLGIDIFKFHYINQHYGNKMGDNYLRQFAKILENTLRQFDLRYLACRSGDDEFWIYIQSSKEEYSNSLQSTLFSFIQQLEHNCKKDHFIGNINGKEIYLNLSYHIGITLFPENFIDEGIKITHEYDIKNLIDKSIKKLESSMFEAKKLPEYSYHFYETTIQNKIANFIFIKQNFYKAIQNDEFIMYYQPIYEIQTQEIIGGEALLRWFHSDRIIPPSEFIPYLEESGNIKEIELIIFNKVLDFYKMLKDQNVNIHLSMNISPVTFNQKDFTQNINKLIQDKNINPENLIFEITETALIQNFNDVNKKTQELKTMGFKIAIDDFGTGYSALSYLEQLEIDILKLDRTLIKEIYRSEKKYLIVESILTLCKKLNFLSVAEGVELNIEYEHLKNLNCDYVQGFLFSRPIPKDDFISLVLNKNQEINKK